MRDGTGPLPVTVLGGTGYVSGELLRLLDGHPRFVVASVVSTSQAGERVGAAFPHLAGTAVAGLTFQSADDVCAQVRPGTQLGIFAATPHGATAALLDRVLVAAEKTGADARAVDLSADFRFADPARFASIYGREHGAPTRCASFVCAVPEHFDGKPKAHAAQPGCFTTSVALPVYPLLALGLVEPNFAVSAITGSSGAGRTPGVTTHHPERRNNVFAYAPLVHRHEPEMRALLAPATGGAEPEIRFVPHSGPFARGIHATVHATLTASHPATDVAAAIAGFYRGSPFVEVGLDMPRVTEVAGTNRCRIGVAARDRALVVTAVLDNLVKGAAGGAVQWMNRLFDLPDETGLRVPGLGVY